MSILIHTGIVGHACTVGQALHVLADMRGLACAGKVTLREYFAQQPQPLEKFEGPRWSITNTHRAHGRTFGSIEPWEDFMPQARNFFNRLDNERRDFVPGKPSPLLPHACFILGMGPLLLEPQHSAAQHRCAMNSQNVVLAKKR